jgi:hypothetical protein
LVRAHASATLLVLIATRTGRFAEMLDPHAAPHRVLLVANRTAIGEGLLDVVERRADARDTRFHLLVPATPAGLHRVVDPEVAGHAEAAAQLALALPELSERAGAEVTGNVGDSDPIAAIQDSLNGIGALYDEIVVSTLPRRLSRWLHLDVVSKARGLGLPVSHVESEARVEARALAAAGVG